MSIDSIIQDAVAKAVDALYDVKTDPKSIVPQSTRKEFEGNLTVVVFPWVKAARKSPEAVGNEIGIRPATGCFQVPKAMQMPSRCPGHPDFLPGPCGRQYAHRNGKGDRLFPPYARFPMHSDPIILSPFYLPLFSLPLVRFPVCLPLIRFPVYLSLIRLPAYPAFPDFSTAPASTQKHFPVQALAMPGIRLWKQ